MIKFFRNIRRHLLESGKNSQYLKYAIGEILLVVIGILIALQINNWNEGRKARSTEKDLIQNILKDLEADNTRYQETLKQVETIRYVYKQLYQWGVQGTNYVNIDNPHVARSIPSFDQLLDTDFSTLGLNLSNKIIRERLLKYGQEQKLLGVAFQELRKVIENRMRPFLGANGLYKLEAIFDDYSESNAFIDQDKLKMVAKTTAFQQLLFEAELKMIGVERRIQNLIVSNSELTLIINDNMHYYQ